MKLPRLLVAIIALATVNVAAAADLLTLRAGPVSMKFDQDNAMLRFIKVGNHEVLRGISAPVRNQFWGTLATDVRNVVVKRTKHSFDVSFDVICREHEVDFTWQGRIVGTPEGKVTFTFDGVARSTFKKNRIGFCILHGPGAAGQKWTIEHTDGKKSPGQFPKFISPHQPAKNIRAITHEVAPGLQATVRCEGDTFEMEDQRNWTDGSFKTYCTPLAIPYPVELKQGTKINHKVQLSVSGDIKKYSQVPATDPSFARLTVDENPATAKPLPRIGLQVSSQVDYLSGEALTDLTHLQLDHLRVSLRQGAKATAAMKRAAEQAHSLGVKLHVVLHLGEKATLGDVSDLVAAVDSVKSYVATVQLNAATTKRFNVLYDLARKLRGSVTLGVAEDTNFTEINRNRPTDPKIKLVSFGLNPQVHARDLLTMIETLEIQGEAVRSARQFIGKRQLHIAPITLKVQKVNRPPLPGQLPSNEDARQATMFAAAWTVGSVKYLAEAGVGSITYFETVGRKGVMAARNQEPSPIFPARPLTLYPVYHTLRALGEFKGGQVQPVSSSNPMGVVGLSVKKGSRRRVLVANFTHKWVNVEVRGLSGASANVLSIDADLARNAARDATRITESRRVRNHDSVNGRFNIRVAPHGICRIDQ